MRPTFVAQAGMPGPKTYIGWWGAMGGPKQKGVVQYALSPYNQKPMAGVFKGWLFNGFSRILHQAPYWIVPVAAGYAVYNYGKTTYAWNCSKEGHHQIAMEEGGH